MRRLYLYKKFTEDGKAVRDAAADIIRPDDDVFVVTEHDRKHEELDKTIEMGRAHDILFVEGLKDYVILQLGEQRIITRMSLKAVFDLLPKESFLRVNKSYIVNTAHIDSFDNNDIFIKSYEIAIGNSYRDDFFEGFVMKQQRW